MLRFHGSRDKTAFEALGYNSRLDELQAALLRVELPHLDGWGNARRAAARHYADAGLGELVALPVAAANSDPAWHLYVARHERPDALASALADAGVTSRGYFRTPLHRQPPLARYAAGEDLPATEEAARTNLALPMGAALTRAQAAEVTAAVRSALAGERR